MHAAQKIDQGDDDRDSAAPERHARVVLFTGREPAAATPAADSRAPRGGASACCISRS